MERFCHKCGSLVTGTGAFCPLCGEAMELNTNSSVNLNKPSDAAFGAANNNDVMPTGAGNPAPQSIPVTPAAAPAQPYGAAPAYAQQPAPNAAPYPTQPTTTVYNTYNTAPVQKHMTTGQWVLTTFLSGLGIIGLILLFVWAFGDNEYPDKKTYARAMLIWQLVAVILVILYIIIIAVIGVSFGAMMNESYYY